MAGDCMPGTYLPAVASYDVFLATAGGPWHPELVGAILFVVDVALGEAVQVEPMKPMLNPPGTKR
jgi:hypothetical protein